MPPMSKAVYSKRCSNHPSREAVARCPICQKFYCRECITEHDGKMLCKYCLESKIESQKNDKKSSLFLKQVIIVILFISSFALSWFLFAMLGKIIMLFPQKYHFSQYENSYE